MRLVYPHKNSHSMKKKYERFISLINIGAEILNKISTNQIQVIKMIINHDQDGFT